MTTGFNGFSPRGLTFLQQVRHHNSKEWFEAHRADYEATLLAPFRALVESLGITMLHLDEQVETRPTKALSCIHRDTRFSRDKSRYRSNMWLTFKRSRKNWTDAPTYFFEIRPDSWHYGLGYYSASRLTMELFRQTLREDPQHFLKVADCLGDEFVLEGESYRRPLIKDQPEALARWYNRKSLAAVASRQDMSALFHGELVTVLAEGFTRLEPLYRYLMDVETMKRTEQAGAFDALSDRSLPLQR